MAAETDSECPCLQMPATVSVQDSEDVMITTVRVEMLDAVCRRCGLPKTIQLIPAGWVP